MKDKNIKKIIGKNKNIDQKIENTEDEIQDLHDKVIKTRESFLEDYSEGLKKKETIKKELHQDNATGVKLDEAKDNLQQMRKGAIEKVEKIAEQTKEKKRGLKILKELKENGNYIKKDPILRMDQQIKKDIGCN